LRQGAAIDVARRFSGRKELAGCPSEPPFFCGSIGREAV